MTFCTVRGSPGLGTAEDNPDLLEPTSFGGVLPMRVRPGCDTDDGPAAKRTRNEAGLPMAPSAACIDVLSVNPRQLQRLGSQRRAPHRPSSARVGADIPPFGATPQAAEPPPISTEGLRVCLRVTPDGGSVHLNILPAVFRFGNVDFSAVAHSPCTSIDYIAALLGSEHGGESRRQSAQLDQQVQAADAQLVSSADPSSVQESGTGTQELCTSAQATLDQRGSVAGGDPATPKDQSRLKQQAESAKGRKQGGFAGSSLLLRIFGGFRSSSGSGARTAAALPLASVQELGAELLHAGKDAALREVAALAASTVLVAGYVQAAPALPPLVVPRGSSDAARSSVDASPAKPAPSPRDTARALPPPQLWDRDQVPAAADTGADAGGLRTLPPHRASSSGGGSLQQSLDEVEHTSGVAALTLLVGLAADAADDDLPTPTLEACESPVTMRAAATTKDALGASAAVDESGTMGWSASLTWSVMPRPASPSSSVPADVTSLPAPTVTSPGSASRAAYSTVSHLVKKIVPGFRDSAASSLMASSAARSPRPQQPPAVASSGFAPAPGASPAVAGFRYTPGPSTVQGAQPCGSPARPCFGIAPSSGPSSAGAAVASPGTASRVAYTTVANLVSKMVPGFRDSVVASSPRGSPRQHAAGAGSSAAASAPLPAMGQSIRFGIGGEAEASTPTAALPSAAAKPVVASPRAASRAAYGTLSALVKKMAPGFRDSVTMSVLAAESPRSSLQPTQSNGTGKASVAPDAAFGSPSAAPLSPTGNTRSFGSPMGPCFGTDGSDALAVVASPRTASKAAYGTVSNIVKKLVPDFRDSGVYSSLAGSDPAPLPRQADGLLSPGEAPITSAGPQLRSAGPAASVPNATTPGSRPATAEPEQPGSSRAPETAVLHPFWPWLAAASPGHAGCEAPHLDADETSNVGAGKLQSAKSRSQHAAAGQPQPEVLVDPAAPAPAQPDGALPRSSLPVAVHAVSAGHGQEAWAEEQASASTEAGPGSNAGPQAQKGVVSGAKVQSVGSAPDAQQAAGEEGQAQSGVAKAKKDGFLAACLGCFRA